MARKNYAVEEIIKHLRKIEIEVENQRLRKLVSDLSLDNMILKEISSKNF